MLIFIIIHQMMSTNRKNNSMFLGSNADIRYHSSDDEHKSRMSHVSGSSVDSQQSHSRDEASTSAEHHHDSNVIRWPGIEAVLESYQRHLVGEFRHTQTVFSLKNFCLELPENLFPQSL